MEYNLDEILKIKEELRRTKCYTVDELRSILNKILLLSEDERINYTKSLNTNYADGVLEDAKRLNYDLVVGWTKQLFYACINNQETFLEGVSLMKNLLAEKGNSTPVLGQEASILAYSLRRPKCGAPDLNSAEYYYKFAIKMMNGHTDKYPWLKDKIGETYEDLYMLYYDMENYQEAINAYNKSKEYDYQPSDLYYKECIQKIEQKKINSQKSSGGCYVATCVYGSYDCPEVWTLRRFRDDILSKRFLGRLFIKCYYAVSPTAVKLFGGYMWFHKLFKSPLDKLVAELQDKGVENTPYNDK